MADKIESMLEEIRSGVKSTADQCKALEVAGAQMSARVNAIEEKFRTNVVSLPGCDEGKDFVPGFFSRAIMGMATKEWNADEDTKKVHDILIATKKRALSAGIDSAGGYVIPAQYMAQLIELLRAESVLDKAGINRISGLGSPIEIPRQSAAATGASTAENAAISFSDQAFQQVTLRPHMVSAGTKLSRRSAALSNPALEGLVRADLARVLALKVDILGLRGLGSSNEPLGVANSGVTDVEIDTNGGPVSYDVLADMIGALEDANALRGNLAFVMHPKVKRKIMKLKDSDGRPLFTWDPSQEQPGMSLLGYPYFTTTQIPTNLTKASGVSLSEIYFGNWSELLMAEFGSLILEASMEAGDSSGGAFSSHQIWVKAVQEVDFAVRHAASFALVNDVETA